MAHWGSPIGAHCDNVTEYPMAQWVHCDNVTAYPMAQWVGAAGGAGDQLAHWVDGVGDGPDGAGDSGRPPQGPRRLAARCRGYLLTDPVKPRN